MTVGSYLEIGQSSKDGHRQALAAKLETHYRAVFAREVTGIERELLTPDEQRALGAVSGLDVAARWGATRLEQADWPHVLYHPGLGGAVTDNFVLFEYLASHGYVVVSSSYLPADGTRLGIRWDAGTSLGDLRRMMAASKRDTPDRAVAVMGHSYGAQAAFIFASQEPGLEAVVSMDSTLENIPDDHPFWNDGEDVHWFEPDALQVPLLLFTSDAAVNGRMFDNATQVVRESFRLPELEHEDFTSHGGVLRPRYLAAQGQSPASATGRGYLSEVRIVHAFLDRELKNSPALWAEWAELPPPEQLKHRSEHPAEPLDDGRAIVLLREHGLAAVEAGCLGAGGCEPGSFLTGLGCLLVGLGELRDAQQCLDRAREIVGVSWELEEALGNLALARGQHARAGDHFDRAAKLVSREVSDAENEQEFLTWMAGELAERSKRARQLAEIHARAPSGDVHVEDPGSTTPR